MHRHLVDGARDRAGRQQARQPAIVDAAQVGGARPPRPVVRARLMPASRPASRWAGPYARCLEHRSVRGSARTVGRVGPAKPPLIWNRAWRRPLRCADAFTTAEPDFRISLFRARRAGSQSTPSRHYGANATRKVSSRATSGPLAEIRCEAAPLV